MTLGERRFYQRMQKAKKLRKIDQFNYIKIDSLIKNKNNNQKAKNKPTSHKV